MVLLKCEKCGNEVDIGEIFCQYCGTPIQIVPEYNPLEDEIETSFKEEKKKEELQKQEERKRIEIQKRHQRQKIQRILIGVVCLCVVILGFSIYRVYVQYQKVHSYSYQFQLGEEYLQKKEYGSAVKCYIQALSYDRESIEVRLSAIKAYKALGDYNRAVELLLEVVNLDPQVEYYQMLMEACELTGNIDLMNRILKENQGNAIGEALSEYRVEKITVNLPGGEYHDYLDITLTSEQKGVTIYYTLDGSQPTKDSTPYTNVIRLDKVGTITLRAVAINEAQLAGEELTQTYIIKLIAPDPPEIFPESGKYEYSKKIELSVKEGATAYFTIDGTAPSKENGYPYIEPIDMPIGNTIFSAMIIDKYGMTSSVVKNYYECFIEREFSYDAAVIKLKNYLVSIEMMTDLNGNRGNGEKINVQFVSLSQIEDKECYIFILRRTVNGESSVLSDKLYAVTTTQGDVYSITKGLDGTYSFIENTE